jgi:multiple sugar transport system permease protein
MPPKRSASSLEEKARPSRTGRKELPPKRTPSIRRASRAKSPDRPPHRPVPPPPYAAEELPLPGRTESLDALSERPASPGPAASHSIRRPSRVEKTLRAFSFNLFAWALLAVYLLPVAFMVTTAFKSEEQLSDPGAPWYPARRASFAYQGRSYPLLRVPFPAGVRELAFVGQERETGNFIDHKNPGAGPIEWTGDLQSLTAVYEPHFVWSNFTALFAALSFPDMMRNTLILVVIGGIGVLISSILVAYGFSRFPVPGGDLLFYILIATILIPEKVTFIPIFFFYVNVMHWQGTFLPLLAYLFFGSPVFIFLLRQNFRIVPIELEEAATLDGAGPLRRLFSIVLPLCWPAVVTVSLLQFFYTWNETRLASLYLGPNPHLYPLSFGISVYSSTMPIQNLIEAGTLVVLAVPLVVLILSQRLFMRSMVITGMEKR